MTRRTALGGFVLTGCAARRTVTSIPAKPAFGKVQVAEDRVIRTVVGLRPYRPSGFVVKRESFGDKALIHNYGHGGGGMTLSWGTSQLAVDLAPEVRQAAVLGCGGVGLATARLLQRRGAQVTIYTKSLPPETTSNIAGAQWWPTSVFNEDKATPAFREQFVAACRHSYRHFQTMLGDYYGVRWIRNYMVSDSPVRNSFILGADSPIRDLYPEYADLPDNATPFERYARRFTTMLIEPSTYLPAVLRDFQLSGGRVVVGEFDRERLSALSEPAIFNCTGLGAGALFGDPEIGPVKGQLTVLLPQPEIDYNLLTGGLYMFPRRDGILLGGTWERGVNDLAPNLEARARVIAGHKEIFARLGT
ncbi:MAG: FAD-dependent oxidoreductase [Bryobacteraceae bacterium]|nr:FAD-dependent oxidoreductase [Bryobacteraceae bacterium]